MERGLNTKTIQTTFQVDIWTLAMVARGVLLKEHCMSIVRTRKYTGKRIRANGTPLTNFVTGPRVALRILQALTHNISQGSGIMRNHGLWLGNEECGEVTVNHIGGTLRLKVAVRSPENKAGLWLEPVDRGFSLKLFEEGGIYTVRVDCRPSECPEFQAKAILSLIVRGKGWKDRTGTLHEMP